MTRKAGNRPHKGPVRQPGFPKRPKRRNNKHPCPGCGFVRSVKYRDDLCQECAQQARIDGSDTEGPRESDPPRLWALHERAMRRADLFA